MISIDAQSRDLTWSAHALMPRKLEAGVVARARTAKVAGNGQGTGTGSSKTAMPAVTVAGCHGSIASPPSTGYAFEGALVSFEGSVTTLDARGIDLTRRGFDAWSPPD